MFQVLKNYCAHVCKCVYTTYEYTHILRLHANHHVIDYEDNHKDKSLLYEEYPVESVLIQKIKMKTRNKNNIWKAALKVHGKH